MSEPHVVVVDEEPLMRWFLGELAKEAGCRVTELQTIDLALRYLHDSLAVVDLVLLDCPRTFADLPRVAALRQLRPSCQLVLMTAFPTERFTRQAHALGIDRVLPKAIDAADVMPLFEATTASHVDHDRATYRIAIPRAVERERSNLHGQLARIAAESGPVGDAAREVERVVQIHATREDSFALPPLGLLPMLAHGVTWSEMRPAVTMADHLTVHLPRMLEDHEAIVAAVQALEQTARQAGRSDVTRLTQRLIEHAELEAEVLYPAAIVAGKFLESQLTDQRRNVH
jgi:CheY-like chemotaxis protein